MNLEELANVLREKRAAYEKVRAEYEPARERMQAALAEADDARHKLLEAVNSL